MAWIASSELVKSRCLYTDFFCGFVRCLVSYSRVKKNSSVENTVPVEALPIEVVQLLDIFARIEVRRQAKLRVSRKVEVHASSEIAS